jgi:hypothetical protein
MAEHIVAWLLLDKQAVESAVNEKIIKTKSNEI